MASSLYFKQMELGPMQNYVYLIGDPETKAAAVVDPAWNVATILDQLKNDGYHLTHIFLTHGHFDHINGVEELVDKTGATVCAHKSELESFIPEGMGGLVIPRAVLKKTDTSEEVKVGRIKVRMIHTPGHTPGSQCLLIDGADGEPPKLLTGDTLFLGTVGRCDFPYSNPKDLFATLKRLKALDEATVIFAGHDYGAKPSNSLKNEKKTNPFLLAEDQDQFLQMVHH